MREQVEEASDALDLRQASQLLVIVVGVVAQRLLVLFNGLQSVCFDHDLLLFFTLLLENVAEVDVLLTIVLILSVEVRRCDDAAVRSARSGQKLVLLVFWGYTRPLVDSEKYLQEVLVARQVGKDD